MPNWVLTLAYELHMAATVVWIGGLFFQAIMLAHALARGVPKEAQSSLRETLQRRFEPLAWLSLAVLVATGLTQMTGNPNYEGLLAIDNRWSSAILAKHLVIAFMVVIAIYQTMDSPSTYCSLSSQAGAAP